MAVKHFNTSGPINQQNHYFIDPLSRMDMNKIQFLIDNQKWFALHAPRQTGKTTYLRALMDFLNKEGKYKALYTNIENAQAARANVRKGMGAILNSLAKDSFNGLKDSFLEDNWKAVLEENEEFSALERLLSLWCQQSEKPVVLFIDEVDALVGDTLISLLRQLRSGYPDRPRLFPQSIILCGVRDVRDYRIHSNIDNAIITGGSAFNIKSESLRMGNFSLQEIETLYLQHTTETGQLFNKDIFPLVWELTEGQPWLVNALAFEACFRMKEGKERGNALTVEMFNQAKENLILRRDSHLDQLSDKLKEERVRRVIGPILAGSQEAEKIFTDDLDYTVDLGLVTKDRQIRIANRIYQEVIPREITYSTQLTIHQESSWYLKENGALDMEILLTAFQEFFRKNFDSWVDGFDYVEAGPQLLLQAFLQRIVNGGGRVEREYGLGRQRTDIMVQWRYGNSEVQEAVIELKLLYGGLESTITLIRQLNHVEHLWKRV